MFKFLAVLKTFLVSAVVATTLQAQAQTPAQAPIKVVYHLSDGTAQATRAIQNIRNHLAADPSAKIVVVTHGAGIDFLLDGATNAQQQSFAGSIGDLSAKGVGFFVCNNTLVSRNIDPSKVAMEAKIVPSGVAEVARLQAREAYVYLRP
ncbi:DsrE family protein [Hydrogenophaga sp.]|uniref:DsrE family protein n=1 Tax=Hydrogenophaga sp. TaxID=1904254 RepID=UPI0027184286|nr:DsrE family protein [Hydrogenophaga sp.]MDO9435110.1 DsrE family protein [Hydrogenophaga sp.]